MVFSAQQATSCGGAENGVFGCAGGDTTSAFEVMADSVGLAPAAFWPYAQGLYPKVGCVDAACTEDCDRDLDVLKHEGYYVGPSASVGAWPSAKAKARARAGGDDGNAGEDASQVRRKETEQRILATIRPELEYRGKEHDRLMCSLRKNMQLFFTCPAGCRRAW